MAARYSAKVTKKEQLADHVYEVDFALVTPSDITFKAGQCMMLLCSPGVNRTMSIASLPDDPHHLTMVHDVAPMGPGSKWTMSLVVGQEVNFVAPTGIFSLDKTSPRKKIFVATGTGIVPLRAMILDYLKDGGDAQLELYWGLRYEKDQYWKDQFDTLFQEHPNFSWHQVFSRPPEGWQGMTGHVTEHLMKALVDPSANDYYLCGNKNMIDDVKNQLLEKGVPKEQIKTELFY